MASDPLELELQTVVSHYMSAGQRTPVLWQGSKYSSSLSHFSTPENRILCDLSLKLPNYIE